MSAYARFDAAWMAFLSSFVSWKHADASSLEASLIDMACTLTQSLYSKCGPDLSARYVRVHPDLSAMVEQVERDVALIRSKVQTLSGNVGVEKFDEAVAAATASSIALMKARALMSAEAQAHAQDPPPSPTDNKNNSNTTPSPSPSPSPSPFLFPCCRSSHPPRRFPYSVSFSFSW